MKTASVFLLASACYAQTAVNGGLHMHRHNPQDRPVAGATVTLRCRARRRSARVLCRNGR